MFVYCIQNRVTARERWQFIAVFPTYLHLKRIQDCLNKFQCYPSLPSVMVKI